MSSLRVGMVVDPVGSYGRGVIRGISAYANGRPQWSIAIEPKWSFETPLSASDWNVDGMLVQVHSKPFEAEVAERGRRGKGNDRHGGGSDGPRGEGFPVVNVSNFVEGIDIPTVVPDDAAIARLAAEYFRSKGFSRLAFFGPLHSEFSRLRMQAFAETAKAWGIRASTCDPELQEPGAWVRSLVTPVGVMGCNDDWAHRLVEVCKRAGLRVPDDVAVLGVDDDELINSLVSPSLSSVPVPAVQVGYEAARMLDEMMKPDSDWRRERDGVRGKRLLIPPTASVVTRQSTDVLAVEDGEVAAAVKFIRLKAGEPIDVEQVLEEVAVSRRALERRFKAALGRGVGSEIRRVRMGRAKQLLAETELPMPAVAERSGFGSATRLGIVFRQTERMTPSRYRQFARGLEAPQAME